MRSTIRRVPIDMRVTVGQQEEQNRKSEERLAMVAVRQEFVVNEQVATLLFPKTSGCGKGSTCVADPLKSYETCEGLVGGI